VELYLHSPNTSSWRGASFSTERTLPFNVPFASVAKYRMLRRIFGTKREDLSEGWRRLHNEELHNL
jgi:hypothetical protein